MTPSKNDPRQCREAIAYVESPQGLLGEYDRAVEKSKLLRSVRRIHEEQLVKLKTELLQDTWWARSVGADVAREVKLVSDLIVQTFALFTPTGKVLEEAAGMPGWYIDNFLGQTETEIFANLDWGKEVLSRVVDAGKAVKTVKSAYDNRESVLSAAQAVGGTVAELAAEELLKRKLAKLGAEKLFPAYKILRTIYSRTKTARQAAEFKATVQEQMENIDRALSDLQLQVALEKQSVRDINEVRSTVIQVCGQAAK